MWFRCYGKLSSIYVFSYFPFGFEGRIWDLIVSVPDHCLSFYFLSFNIFMMGKVKVVLYFYLTSGILTKALQ